MHLQSIKIYEGGDNATLVSETKESSDHWKSRDISTYGNDIEQIRSDTIIIKF